MVDFVSHSKWNLCFAISADITSMPNTNKPEVIFLTFLREFCFRRIATFDIHEIK